MSEDNSVKDFHLFCLHALQSQRPDKPMGQVRWAWAEINAALNAGHTLKVVHQRLCQDGVVIAYSTLARYVNRIRCEEARQNLRAGALASSPGRRPLKAQTHPRLALIRHPPPSPLAHPNTPHAPPRPLPTPPNTH